MEDNTIILVDENGKEEVFKIVLTFSHPETNAQYVVFEKENNDDAVYAYRYDDENNLYPIEDEKEWQFVEEVLESFNSDEQED